MSCIILESPFAGDVEANIEYARQCLRDSLHRGESPIASHLLYTQPGVLDDTDHIERTIGIEAGLQWLRFAEKSVVYIDRGVSPGMQLGIARARALGIPVELRTLPAPHQCRFCGAPSYYEPIDQTPPADYCHPVDHGSYDPA